MPNEKPATTTHDPVACEKEPYTAYYANGTWYWQVRCRSCGNLRSQNLRIDGRAEMLCDGVQISAGDGTRFRPAAGSTGETMDMYWTEKASKLQAELASRGVELDAADDVIAANAGGWFAAMGANEQAAVIGTMRYATGQLNASVFQQAYGAVEADQITASCNIAFPPSAQHG